MSDTVEIRIIGRAHTPWKRREDAPHQPGAARDVEGVVVVEPEYAPALADLDSFERIWLVFFFDRSRGWTTRVKPPRGGSKRGLFATRSPDRPSGVGLSNVELVDVDVAAGRVRVRGIDLLDGTPVLDIKPYLPNLDAWPSAGHGWLEPYLEAGIEPRLEKPYRPPR